MRRDLPRDLEPADARRDLIALLRLAFSAELAAALAYGGHRRSLSDAIQAAEIERIRLDEIDHRDRIRGMLERLGSGPNPLLDLVYALIGSTISILCLFGGWFVPMYGAGVLESRNVTPYERAARLAVVVGRPEFVEDLLEMAEVEWDHELYFRVRRDQHWMRAMFPRWRIPPPREEIRATFDEFRRAATSSSPSSSPSSS